METKKEKKKVIVRGDRSGVFFGTLVGGRGRTVELENCRRIWCWSGAASVSQIATDGVGTGSKITVPVEKIMILDAIEILFCSAIAIENLENFSAWKM